MNIQWKTYRLQCTHPFGISRSSHTFYDVIYVYLVDGDIVGRGEAAPSARYLEYHDQIIKQLKLFDDWNLPDGELETVWHFLEGRTGGIKSLEAAFSMAVLDWWGQKIGKSIGDLFNVPREPSIRTSFTIAIGDLDTLPQKIEEAEPYPILKVKLGTPDDKDIINIIRNETDKVIRVDANEGWTLASGIEMCHWLSDRNVEFIEQPLPAKLVDDTAKLREESPLPIIADENSLVASNIPEIAHAFDGINIKLMKCGSLFEAKRMIDTAHEYNLKIMFGCMVESSVGITAASHLSPDVDFADLDGHILIDNDPYLGTRVEDGYLILPSGTGLGISMKENSSYELL